MRITLLAGCLALVTGLNLPAQTSTNGAARNGSAQSVFGGAGEGRSVFAKPTIKDLMQRSPFTNATGMVMVFSGIGNLLAPPLGNSLAALGAGLPFIFWVGMAVVGSAGLVLANEKT